ncbi:MAG: hypothetical protein E7Z97_01715 [Propionibacteriaceae bacterium]|jgi:L-fuculose-phosphate aldolase|nr:hypothetical protein [Propionibacteriaceae bacterium]
MTMTAQEKIVQIAHLMFTRHLTDLAGGNISMRDGDTIYTTPRYAGARQHWDLQPEDIMVGSVSDEQIFENPRFTREGISHVYAYRHFAEANAIIHAHSPWMLPFASFDLPMEAVLKSTQTFGTLEIIPEVEPYSKAQSDEIIRLVDQHRERIGKHGAPVLIPGHGVFIIGMDLDTLIDSVERLNTNAMVLLARPLVEQLRSGV